jgi:cytochrome c oxidase subunit 2
MPRPVPLLPVLVAALCLLLAGCGRGDHPASTPPAGDSAEAPAAAPAGDVLAAAPDDTPEVFIVTKPWMWKAQYWNGVRVIFGNGGPEPGSVDAGLVLPVGRPVKLTLISEAEPRRLIIAAFGLEANALPLRYTSVVIRPTRIGSFPITDPDPGPNVTGPKQVGTVRVVEAAEFETWLSGDKPVEEGSLPAGLANDPAAWEGRQLFRKLQCAVCHVSNRPGDPARSRAPSLEGLWGTTVNVRTDPKAGAPTAVTFDEAYVIESIRRPQAKVVKGWGNADGQSIMPAYDDRQLSDEEVRRLVVYIRFLKTGRDTPPAKP